MRWRLRARPRLTTIAAGISVAGDVAAPSTAAPSFSASPVIIGVPTVGVPVSYVPGTVSGSPTPSVTRQWLLDGSNISGATNATYTPVEGDIGTGRLSVRETATNIAGSANSTSATRDVAASGSTETTFSLTSAATTATRPFTIGVGFEKGVMASGSIATDLSQYQVVVKRTWSDGSVKHAIISGRAALTQNVARTVAISAGTSPSGTDLTASSIQTAAPTAIVQCGSFGTVSLASLLGSPVRTWVSGPEMVECHYRADVGGGTLLSVWFHVRLWADGTMWVRAIVENGYLDNGSGAAASNADRSYVPTVSVGGSNVYTNGGASLAHYKNTRWSVEGWIGTNPQVTFTHDVTYIDATKLVPHYGWRTPSEDAYDTLIFGNGVPTAWSTATYTPMMQGDVMPHQNGQGEGGYGPHIGLLMVWNALYLTSGDRRALDFTLNNSSAMNGRPIVWRKKSTETVPTPSDFPTWSHGGPGGAGFDAQENTNGWQWDQAHHPNEGYLAYLLTGDYWHLETLAMNAAMNFFILSSARGSGTSRVWQYPQPRGIAWAMRTVGCYAAIAPTGDSIAADYRTWLSNGIDYWEDKVPADGLGVMTVIGEASGQRLRCNPWVADFQTAALGYLWDVEPGFASTTNHQTLRDYCYKSPVGRLGGTDGFYYPRATFNDGLVLSASNFNGSGIYYPTDGSPAWYTTWVNAWTATNSVNLDSIWGYANQAAMGTALLGSGGSAPASAPTGNWGILLPAIAYAVEHEAPGAAAAYTRLLGASNWNTVNTAGFDDTPVWGVKPRIEPPYALPTADYESTFFGNDLVSVRAVDATLSDTALRTAIVNLYGSPVHNPYYGDPHGAVQSIVQGGHGDTMVYDDYVMPLSTATYLRRDNAHGITQASMGIRGIPGEEQTGSPWWELLVATGTHPSIPHTYANMVVVPGGTNGRGQVYMVGRGAMEAGGTLTSQSVHKYDVHTRIWTRVGQLTVGSVTDAGAHYDPVLQRIYYLPNNQHSYNRIEYVRLSDDTIQSVSTGGFMTPIDSSNVRCGAIWVSGRMLLLHGTTSLAGLDITSDATIGAGWEHLEWTGSLVGSENDVWCWHNGRFWKRRHGSNTTMDWLQPPASSPMSNPWSAGNQVISGGLPTRPGGNGNYRNLYSVPTLGPKGMLVMTSNVAANGTAAIQVPVF